MEKRNILKPSFYDRFQCKGGDCRYTCCQGWNISLTKEEYRKWKKKEILTKEEWEKWIIFVPEGQKTERNYAMFTLTEQHVCPLLDSNGLCQVQKKHGPEVMTNTCMVFPRQYHRYFDQVENSLSLGCEKVLELLMEEKDGILLEQGSAFYSPGFVYGSFYEQAERRKHPQLRSYYDIQTLSLMLLQTEGASMEDRLVLLGMAIYSIDQLYKEGKEDFVPAYIGEYLTKLENSDVENILKDLMKKDSLASYNSVYRAMSVLTPVKNPALEKVRTRILDRLEPPADVKQGEAELCEAWKRERYSQCLKEFEERLKGKEYFIENVMVEFLLYSNLPYKDIKNSIWENYLYFVWVYMMIKVSLSAYLLPESTEEDMIYCLAVLFRVLAHNTILFHQVLEDFKKDGDTLAHVAILLKNTASQDGNNDLSSTSQDNPKFR